MSCLEFNRKADNFRYGSYCKQTFGHLKIYHHYLCAGLYYLKHLIALRKYFSFVLKKFNCVNYHEYQMVKKG